MYGVWAARGGPGGLAAEPVPGGWRLTGRKPFCSGSGIIDRALVTAEAPDGYRLFDVDAHHGVTGDLNSWPTVGMADSHSETQDFHDVFAPSTAEVGEAGFYLQRPGFWSGASGVAACWYGGARGLLEGVLAGIGDGPPNDLVLLELGRAAGEIHCMRELLHLAADQIDEDPANESGTARRRALSLRQSVHRSCHAVLGHTASAGGARPLCHDAQQAQRASDLYVYLAQQHGNADAVDLGEMALREYRGRRS